MQVQLQLAQQKKSTASRRRRVYKGMSVISFKLQNKSSDSIKNIKY